MADSPGTTEIAPAVEAELACPKCGYNLRGLREYRCPECGESFDPAALSETTLPWAHRRRLGRIRAYWRMVEIVTIRPGELAAQLAYPMNYCDAQRFRGVTVFLAWLPLLIATINNQDGGERLHWIMPDGAAMGLGITVICHMAALAVLAAITGIPSYFFHPAGIDVERQNRAIALTYYTAAPMSLSAFVFLITLPLMAFGPLARAIALLILTLLQFLLWWRALVVLARRGTCADNLARVVFIAAATPLGWLMAGIAVWFVIVAVLLMPVLLFYSLQA